MTLRTSSRHKRPRWVGLVFVVVALSALAISTTVASTITAIPSNFFTVVDQQGANDVNSDQVDLTQFGRDDSNSSKYKLFWSWDSINSWTGSGQTGDACALFDTGTDGKIDKAVCARVTNLNADPNNVQIVPQDATHPVFLFDCSNAKNDRCAQPSAPKAYNSPADADAGVIGTLAKANLITDTDPFAAGSSYPHDTTIEVDVLKTLVGGGTLVNVCSYPSAGNGGNNNPFDCIVTPGGGFLKIVKDAGSDTTTPFPFTVSPAPVAPQPSTYTINGSGHTDPIGIAITGTGSVTETVPTDWNLTAASCVKQDGTSTGSALDTVNHKLTNIVIESGKLTTCTFHDALKSGTLVVKKLVVNDNGGSKHATDFSFSLNSGAATAFTQDGTNVLAGKNSMSLTVGTAFSVAEVGTPIDGYTTSYDGCTGTIAANSTSTCTITNDDQAATLIVKKVVVNDNGGTAHATDFSFKVGSGATTAFVQDGTDVLAGKNTLTVNAGTYSVAEVGTPVAGYTTTYDNCSGVVIANGATATCTITNDDQAATLIVKKVVVNDNGGTGQATDFSFSANGGATTAFLQDGANILAGKNTLTVNAGTYSVAEVGTPIAGYTTTYDNCSGTIANGGTATCTITNNDQAATLIVKKVVINDNGGSGQATDFSFSANGGATTAFLQDGSDPLAGKNTLTVNAGSYSVAEVGTPIAGYTTTYDKCSGTIANGATATCTITNNDQAATLIVKKVVINDNGGTAHATDFSFKVGTGATTAFVQDGTDVLAGKNTLTVNAGTYSVAEVGTPVAGYDTTYDNCASVTVANGGTATCTITNNDTKNDPSGNTTMAWKISDSASFSIRAGGTGTKTITFRLYSDSDGILDATTCTAAHLVGSPATASVALTNLGATATAASGDFTVGVGHYFWVATYDGDSFNNTASTSCGSEVTTIQ